MNPVKVKGTFTKDSQPLNGLVAIAEELVDESLSRKTYLVVAEIRPHTSTLNADDGEWTATVRLDHIEVVTDARDRETLKSILSKIYNERTGQSSIFDITEG